VPVTPKSAASEPAPQVGDGFRVTRVAAAGRHRRKDADGEMLSGMKRNPGFLAGTTQVTARRLMVLQAAWLVFLFGLGIWWVSLMLEQAGRIATLEQAAGVTPGAAQEQWMRTERMLFWEGGTFFGALILSLILLGGLHWRDSRRAQSLRNFFASVTHELRTPLSSLRLEAEGLSELIAPGTPGRTLVDRMLEDSARLESEVERALELARVEGGGAVITQPVDVGALVGDLLRTWRPTLQRAVQIDNQAGHLGILASPAALQTILRNLLENSVRHAETDSLVIRIDTDTVGDRVQLTVSDNGTSRTSPPKSLGTLFARGENSRGAGVGLYLTDQLMRRMKGEARFQPGPSGFQVHLLFKPEDANA